MTKEVIGKCFVVFFWKGKKTPKRKQERGGLNAKLTLLVGGQKLNQVRGDLWE